MDKFDAAAAMRCNHELLTSDNAGSDETTALLNAAIKAAGADPESLNKQQTIDFYTYAAGSAMRWREGQELELLAACKA